MNGNRTRSGHASGPKIICVCMAGWRPKSSRVVSNRKSWQDVHSILFTAVANHTMLIFREL